MTTQQQTFDYYHRKSIVSIQAVSEEESDRIFSLAYGKLAESVDNTSRTKENRKSEATINSSKRNS